MKTASILDRIISAIYAYRHMTSREEDYVISESDCVIELKRQKRFSNTVLLGYTEYQEMFDAVNNNERYWSLVLFGPDPNQIEFRGHRILEVNVCNYLKVAKLEDDR